MSQLADAAQRRFSRGDLVYADFGEDLLVRLEELGFDTELHVHRPSADVDAAVTFVSRKRTA